MLSGLRSAARAGAALAVAWAADPAAAQSLPADPPLPPVAGVPSPAPPPAEVDALPAYEGRIERLAERLGTLSFLRDLCGTGDAAAWRGRMAALLEAEAPAPPRRDRLAGAFNRGFRGYGATYRTCTPSARLAMARARAEAETLTRDLTGRFGGT